MSLTGLVRTMKVPLGTCVLLRWKHANKSLAPRHTSVCVVWVQLCLGVSSSRGIFAVGSQSCQWHGACFMMMSSNGTFSV